MKAPVLCIPSGVRPALRRQGFLRLLVLQRLYFITLFGYCGQFVQWYPSQVRGKKLLDTSLSVCYKVRGF